MNYYPQYNSNSENSLPGAPLRAPSADAAYIEKYRAKRAGNATGAALLIQTVLATAQQYGFLAVCMLMGYDYFTAAGILTSDPYLWLFQGIASVAAIVPAFMIGSRIYGMKVRESVMALSPCRKGDTLPLVLACCGVCTAANLMSSQFLSVIGYEQSSTEELFVAYPQGVWGFVITLLVVGIIPALAEEFAFRGVVLGILRNISDGFAVFASALIFGIMHGNLTQIPFAFIMGLAFGFVTVKTRSIWPAVIFHAVNNSFAVVMDMLAARVSEPSANVLYMLYFGVMALVGLLGFILSVKRDPNMFSINKTQCALPAVTRLRVFLTAPCMVIYLILVALEILAMELFL